jgi:5-oxopent-3-ene-1,2,5-tricarboxylate decarboxylase/2-hydroxyhepta-2,4-diene-1,7-dioate isomerase
MVDKMQVLLKTRSAPAPKWTDLADAERLASRPGGLEPPVSGTVYGVVLNVRSQVELYGEALTKPPYQAPPRAPVLYIKTPNTYAPNHAEVAVPAGVDALEVNATLAVVMGRSAGRIDEAEALEAVLGYTVAIDVCIPHESLYRPPIRQRCRDGFLPIGPWITPRDAVANPDALDVVVSVNGETRSRFSTAELVRPVAQLIADVSAFMTFASGDVLLVGLPAPGPQARAGDRVRAEIMGVGALDCRLVAEANS